MERLRFLMEGWKWDKVSTQRYARTLLTFWIIKSILDGFEIQVAQVVAKEFGIPVSKVIVKPASNFNSPNTTATDASNGTECVCAVR